MNHSLNALNACLNSIPQHSYPKHSRVHLLKSFNFPSSTCFVKRDDELGFGISGSKIRKYRSLIPFFLQQKIREIVVLGSAFSNHVLSLIQLLIENGLQPTLFLRGNPERCPEGNLLLSSLFVPHASIHWFSKKDWKFAELKAHEYAKNQPHKTFVLPEGGFCAEALPGALSLTLDLKKNESEMDISFDHIFIEAGTGFMASSLILGLNYLQSSPTVHVLLLVEDFKAFSSRLKNCHEMFMHWTKAACAFPQNFILHLPKITQKFGQTNAFLFQCIKTLAREEGFLTDPIYSAKLFIETRYLLSLGHIKGNILILHSGGALTLLGFQNQLAAN